MKTQNSAPATKGSKTENKNSVNNTNTTTRRVVVTRDEYAVVFDHAVSLVVAYALGQTPEKPREGFAFGPIANGNHTRNYAKSLIWGFATNKAGKTIKAQKGFEELADKANREKIATAILTDCLLVKGDSKAIAASLAKVEPKRERVFAEAVLTGLNAADKKATPKGGKDKKSETKDATPKGGRGKKSETKDATLKGSNDEPKVVVYDYIHFNTPFGVVTTPTTGKSETEESNAIKSLRTYLQSELAALTAEGSKQTAATAKRIKKIEDFLNADSAMQSCKLRCLAWSNEVTPKDLGKKKQIVIVEKA